MLYWHGTPDGQVKFWPENSATTISSVMYFVIVINLEKFTVSTDVKCTRTDPKPKKTRGIVTIARRIPDANSMVDVMQTEATY